MGSLLTALLQFLITGVFNLDRASLLANVEVGFFLVALLGSPLVMIVAVIMLIFARWQKFVHCVLSNLLASASIIAATQLDPQAILPIIYH